MRGLHLHHYWAQNLLEAEPTRRARSRPLR